MSRSFLILTAIALGAVAAPGGLAAQERAPTRAEASKARSRAERDRARTEDRAQDRTGPRIHITADDLGLGDAVQLGLKVGLREGLGRDLQAALNTGLHAGLDGLGAGLGAGIAGLAEGLASLDGIVITSDDDRRQDRRSDRDRDDRRETRQDDYRIDSTVSLGRNGNVELRLISGPITVTAWDRDEVRVRASSAEIPIYLDRSGGTVRAGVRDESRRTRTRDGRQSMEVMVPVGTRVSASTVSGSISVRGVRGELEASTVSGSVEASEVTRRARLNSVSGSVVASRVDGDVRANSVSGRVTLDDVEGDVEAGTVSGAIQLRGVRSSRVKTNTVSGRVSYDGTFERDGSYAFNSFSGTIDLALPTSAAGTVGVQTFSGSIDSDFTMTLRPGTRSYNGGRSGGGNRNMEFTLGEGGGARLSAQTFSGNINLRRGSRPRSDDRE